MQQIKLGEKVKSIGIFRTKVAEGIKGRAILLDQNPRVKQMFYDSVIKQSVECDEDSILELRIVPRLSYFMLLGRLETGMEGEVKGDRITIEYAQMAPSVYEEFIDTAEGREVSNISMKMVEKNKFSYVKYTVANIELPQYVYDKLESLITDQKVIDDLWDIIDQTTSIPMIEYKKQIITEAYYKKQLAAEAESGSKEGIDLSKINIQKIREEVNALSLKSMPSYEAKPVSFRPPISTQAPKPASQSFSEPEQIQEIPKGIDAIPSTTFEDLPETKDFGDFES